VDAVTVKMSFRQQQLLRHFIDKVIDFIHLTKFKCVYHQKSKDFIASAISIDEVYHLKLYAATLTNKVG
jgi:hypothetical protein